MKYAPDSRILAIYVLLLTGCATIPQWQAVSKAPYTNSKQGYTLNLPKGWLEITSNDRTVLELTRNGESLNLIIISRSDGAKAFPASKKSACLSANQLPSDLAADFIADVKVQQSTDTINVLKNELATIGGVEGFHLNLGFTTKDGLGYRSEAYGACSGGKFYALIYRAPKIYYFDKDLPVFNAMVASFKITGTAGH